MPKSPAAKKRPTGRPSTFSQDVADRIISEIETGKTLNACSRMPGLIPPSTFLEWCDKRPALAARYSRARERGMDRIAEEALDIIDGDLPVLEDKAGRQYTDSGRVNWLRNRAEVRMKLLAVWDPRRFGNRVSVDGEVKHNHMFPAAFSAAMSSSMSDERQAKAH